MLVKVRTSPVRSSNFRSPKKVRAIFWRWMTNYNTKRIQVIFRRGFNGILDYFVSGPKFGLAQTSLDFPWLPRTSLDSPGHLLVSVLIMSDKVIWDHKKSYLIYFENFDFLWFFHLWPSFAKNRKNKNFQNWLNMTFYGLKWLHLTQSTLKLVKVRGSPAKSGPHFDEH